jgi:hypothetical protein
MAEFHFRSMEASQKKCDVTIQFPVGGLVIHFAGIFHLSSSVQKLFKNFLLCNGEIFFQFLGTNLTPEIFFANLETPRRHYPEKICVN